MQNTPSQNPSVNKNVIGIETSKRARAKSWNTTQEAKTKEIEQKIKKIKKNSRIVVHIFDGHIAL